MDEMSEVWDSGTVLYMAKIVIDSDVLKICQSIQQKVGNGTEFSALFNSLS